MSPKSSHSVAGMTPSAMISHLDQVTSEWLTSVLVSADALKQGSVAAIDVETGGGNWSTSAQLTVHYTEDAQGDRPRHLFLKMVNADLDDEFFGPSEVAYYTRDYLGVDNAPLIRCYDAHFSEKERRYHLLLDDISAAHVQAAKKAPTLAYGRALAEGLAAMHAHWWGAERLAEADAPIHGPNHIRRFVEIAKPGAMHIIEELSGELEPHWPALIRDLYRNHSESMIRRTHDDEGFTLIHGDVGAGNVLVPRDGDRPLYIIDRQPFDWSLTTWLGVYDLAYAIVLDWEVEVRRRLEIPVLRQYHAHLSRNSVSDYSWQQLLNDYRLCVAMGVYIATEYCRGGINEAWRPVWTRMLRRALTACDDLNCRELWR